MDLTTREDIEAPIAFVFAQATDFDAFERQALRRGAEVTRRDTLPRPDAGATWDVTFKFRGRDRALTAVLTEFDPPSGFSMALTSGGIEGDTTVDLVALSRGRTRLSLTTQLSASGLAARLLLQSLRLARGSIQDRLARRVSVFALDVQDRYARQS